MSLSTPARPDLAAYEEATRASKNAVVTQLRDLLGVRLVAVIAGVKETRAVHEWADSDRPIRTPGVEVRLRTALQAARMISDAESSVVAQSWMQGLNPALNDQSPARVLREGDIDEDGASVLAAARAFAGIG